MPSAKLLRYAVVAATLACGVWWLEETAGRFGARPEGGLNALPSRGAVVIGYQSLGRTTTPVWYDPSVEPEVLRRAYAPAGRLPPQARPVLLPIEPTEEDWERLRREGNLPY